MKAIIIAAGKGSRLKEMTKDTPKCLLTVKGKTILDYQLQSFSANGIIDISLVKGYCQQKLSYPNIKYYLNEDYENNNILVSLMCARQDMDTDFIASYSDIIFEEHVVQSLLKSKDAISIVVDTDFKKHYLQREGHPLDEAEKVLFDDKEYVNDIGKKLTQPRGNTGEFIGMMKCTQEGAQVFRRYFQKASLEFSGRAFMKAKVFEQAYLTDFILYLTQQGVKVKCVLIQGGWQEIDVIYDLNKAREVYERSTI